MSLQFKSKKLLKLIALLGAGLLSGVIVFWSIAGKVWTTWDFQILDLYYRLAVQYGYGPPLSPRVIYVTITDESYKYFDTNDLDRSYLAKVNNALADYGVEAVAYDIIFANPSNTYNDQLFKESLSNLKFVYLPIGFAFAKQALPFRWKEGVAYERLQAEYLKNPIEKGIPNPLYATDALMQLDEFAEVAFNSGHITLVSDLDGVYRHIPMLLRIDSQYFPTLALAMYLNYVRVPFEEVIVDWGREMIIPAKQSSFLTRDVTVPIDGRGRAFIPYAQVFDQDFKKMEIHNLLQYRENENLQGNLIDFFEGKFVIIADIMTGSDIGHTPLEDHIYKVISHAALLNGLLTNTFYIKWSFWQVIVFICIISIILGLSALLRSLYFLYITGAIVFAGIIVLTWQQFICFSLMPIVTIESSFLFVFFGLVIGLQVAISKDRAFIRNAFSKYVPEKVVNELLNRPELLQLGGEERSLSVLFSDLENFTAIAENMGPAELVSLLNEYLSEMTDIILLHQGIIDKYQGDAIMAEFGAPLALPNHADLAVRAALAMQRRLHYLRGEWDKRGLPALRCRVGINTGSMVVGNMGSRQVFDYTVMGDAVNLASRLESANKLYRTYVMISESTYDQLSPGMFRTRVLDVITVKGKSRAVKVFEVYGEAEEEVGAKDLSYYQTYHEAFEAYLSRQFAAAQAQFTQALSLRPDDPAAQAMLARLETLNPDDLPDDWDGSVVLTSK
jgi:adenylate cyclase